MFYNKQYITSPPNTTDQLINTCLQVNSTYHVWCIAYGIGSEWGYRFAAWFAGFGGQIFGPNNMPQLNSSAMANALEFWYNLTYGLHINAPDMNPSLRVNYSLAMRPPSSLTGRGILGHTSRPLVATWVLRHCLLLVRQVYMRAR
nr:hypothetical protein [Vulcanisaeta sp. JCM 16159]